MSHTLNSSSRSLNRPAKPADYKTVSSSQDDQKVDLLSRESIQKRSLRDSIYQERDCLNDQDSVDNGVIPFSDEEEQLEFEQRVTNQTISQKANTIVMSVVALVILGMVMFAAYQLWISFARNK
jgi:cytochrome c-type biogenesis protein CcmH/NrfG